jgi:hypothetical protein
MKIGNVKSKSMRFLYRGLRVKPKTLAGWFNISIATVYRHLCVKKEEKKYM